MDKHSASWKGLGPISGSTFYRLIRNATVRNLQFNLTIEDVLTLYQKQNGRCALSGLPISFPQDSTEYGSASLDRIDSSKHYTVDNVWWVHKDVNLMKMDLPLARFIELAKAIASNN